MKRIALAAAAAAMALGSSLALAQTSTAAGADPAGPGVNPNRGMTSDRGVMADRGRTDPSDPSASDATAYWNQHAKDGYMTREDSLNYPPGNMQRGSSAGTAAGGSMDYSQMDTDHDGRTSQSEWMAWQRDHGAMMGSDSSSMKGGSSGASRDGDQGTAGRNNNNNTKR